METGKEQVVQVYFGGADAFYAKLAECEVKNFNGLHSTVGGTRFARFGHGAGNSAVFCLLCRSHTSRPEN